MAGLTRKLVPQGSTKGLLLQLNLVAVVAAVSLPLYLPACTCVAACCPYSHTPAGRQSQASTAHKLATTVCDEKGKQHSHMMLQQTQRMKMTVAQAGVPRQVV